MIAAIAVTCTIPDYPARPNDADKSGVSGGEGGDSGGGQVAGAGGSAGGAGLDGDGGHADGGHADGGGGGESLSDCGNGERVAPEECDDGNVQSNDGCSASCRLEIREIAAGGNHTCVRFADDEVACWGHNTLGQLGLDRIDQEDINANRGDAPNELGVNLIKTNLGASVRVVALSLGYEFSCAFDGGSVKCWGNNSKGQLGLGHTVNRGMEPSELADNLLPLDLGTEVVAKQIQCGLWHCCALLEGGDVKCWGENSEDGQLGLGDNTDKLGELAPTKARRCRSRWTSALGTLPWRWHSATTTPARCSKANSVKCWGDGVYGQLGNESAEDRGRSVSDMGDNLKPIDFGDDLKAVQIEAGSTHTCAILENHKLKCWGDNEAGQLGIGSDDRRGDQPGEMGVNLPSVNLGQDRYAVRVSAGYGFTCARLDDRSIKCWGGGFGGVLGERQPRSCRQIAG